MKILVVLANIFACPIGTFLAGKITIGIIQLILLAFAVFLYVTLVGVILAIPLAFIVWVWGIVIAIQYNPDGDGIQRYG